MKDFNQSGRSSYVNAFTIAYVRERCLHPVQQFFDAVQLPRLQVYDVSTLSYFTFPAKLRRHSHHISVSSILDQVESPR